MEGTEESEEHDDSMSYPEDSFDVLDALQISKIYDKSK